MPKAIPSNSAASQGPKASDDSPAVAARKKKNAEAQAAFRERRNQYIATLEEAVTNLESVIRALQEAARENYAEMQELQSKHARLSLEYRAREMLWRNWGRSKNLGDQLPEIPPSIVQQLQHEAQVYGRFQYQGNLLDLGSESSGLLVLEGFEDPDTGSSSTPSDKPTVNIGYRFSQDSYPLPPQPRDLRWSQQPISVTGANPIYQMSQSSPVSFESPCLITSVPHGEVTSDDGTADVSLPNIPSDAQRFPLISENLEHTPLVGTSIRPFIENVPSSHHNIPATGSGALFVASESRAKSPHPPVDSVSVIKGQVFGVFRRKREDRPKKSGGAAETVAKVINARGLDIGIAVERPRVDHHSLSTGAHYSSP